MGHVMNMTSPKRWIVISAFCVATALTPPLIPASRAMTSSQQQTPEGPGASAAARHIGAIKAIAGNAITLTPRLGP